METKYSELSKKRQKEVEKELKHEPEVFEEIKKGNYCAKCYMIWYNCLCTHEN